MKIKDKILSETPKEETKCYCGHTMTCDCIPLEEPKQETLEEASKRFLELWVKNNTSTRRLFIEGAKWQMERSYSEEEVHDIIDNYFEWRFCGNHNIGYDEWFEQFKKK